ncbi:MAG TPA: ceramidase domain-containing protein [Acidiferrobacterales bacterium]|nr:ceramidase domain-containing protein [Acidiferrobacterales bacterium]
MDRHRHLKLKIIIGLALFAVVAVFLTSPIPQDPSYHHFADQRQIFGIPNFWNVVSNLPFMVVGLLGLRLVLGGPITGGLPELRPAYLVFFLGVALIALGSGYYHLSPSNPTLLWDRLPITISFMAFFSIIVGENIAGHFGRRMLWPLVFVGIVSVVYWSATEVQGNGDLRLYALVQFLPMVLIPVILVLFRSSVSKNGYIWAVLGAYAASKVVELQDEAVFRFFGVVSGHFLKHLFAALGTYFFFLALKRRRLIVAKSQ